MRNIINSLLLLSMCLVLSCENKEQDLIVAGMKPVYISAEEVRNLNTTGPVAIQEAGKIYTKGNLLFINDRGRGVHVFDNSDPAAPQAISFINIPRNFDIAIKDNILYADNGPDLIAVDISNPENAQLTKRIENAYADELVVFPPDYEGYFECVDSERGIVLDWEMTQLTNPECRR